MVRLGMQTLAHMGGGVEEEPQHIRMGMAEEHMQAAQCLVVMSAVGMAPMEQQGGTVNHKAGQAGVLPLALTSLHIHQPLTGLPGQHSGAEDAFFAIL